MITSVHLEVDELDALVRKLINTVEVQEKVKLAQYMLKLCNSLIASSEIIKNHVARCKDCKTFLDSRKSLAKLIIKGAKK